MRKPMVKITIDVFSGRENPEIAVPSKKIIDYVERMTPRGDKARREVGLPPVPTLGYRGLVVEAEGIEGFKLPRSFRVVDGHAIGPDFSVPLADQMFEDFVCGSVPKEFRRDLLVEEIDRFRYTLDYWRKWRWDDLVVWPKKKPCKCAPLYEPQWWNQSWIQPYNNCYNYSTNYRTNTYAQPGRAASAQYASLTCSAVKAASIADQLIDSPGSNNKCPAEGHLVALVVAPDWDYHWYRKGRDGSWSHKPGGTAVTNLDNSGNQISDPRSADRGPYTEFCTFMVVKHGHIKIN